MNCPKCNERMYVDEQKTNGKQTFRRYKCPSCKWIMHTEEKHLAKAKDGMNKIHRKYNRKNVDE